MVFTRIQFIERLTMYQSYVKHLEPLSNLIFLYYPHFFSGKEAEVREFKENAKGTRAEISTYIE